MNNTSSTANSSSSATPSPNASAGSAHSSHAGAIAGGIIGGLAAVAIISTLTLILARRKQRRLRQGGTHILVDFTDRGMPGRYSGSEARATPFVLARKASVVSKASKSSQDSTDRTSFWTEVKPTVEIGRREAGKETRRGGRSLRPDVYDDLKPPAYTYDIASSSKPDTKS